MNVTIDDTSPRIRYNSVNPSSGRKWSVASANYDQFIANYYKATFMVTTGDGDQMVFKFNGSAIWVYGGNNDNHGWYSARVDDFAIERFNIDPPSVRSYQDVLYHRDGLDVSVEHTITVTNIASDARRLAGLDSYFDIDYIVIQQPIEGQVFTTNLDDASPQIKYSALWTAEVHDDGFRGHISAARGDTMTIPFNGTSIEILGSMFPDHGNYTVSIDGVNKGTFNGLAPRPMYGVSMFSATGLKEGLHSVVLINLGGPTGNYFDVDRIIFNSTIDPSPPSAVPASSISSTATSPSVTPPSSITVSSSRQATPFLTGSPTPIPQSTLPSVAGIAGGIAGGFAALIILGILGWLLWSRKRRAGEEPRRAASQIDLTGEEVKPYQDSPTRLEEVRSGYFMPEISPAGSHTATTLPLLPSADSGHLPSQLHSSPTTFMPTPIPQNGAAALSSLTPASDGLRPSYLSDTKSALTMAAASSAGHTAARQPISDTQDGRGGVIALESAQARAGESGEAGPPPYEHATGR